MLNCIYDRTVCTLHIHFIIMVQFCFFFFLSPSLRTANSEQWIALYTLCTLMPFIRCCVQSFFIILWWHRITQKEKKTKEKSINNIAGYYVNVPMYQCAIDISYQHHQKHLRFESILGFFASKRISLKFFKIIRLFSCCLFPGFFQTLSTTRISKSFEISFRFVFLPCQLPHQINYKRQAEIYLV